MREPRAEPGDEYHRPEEVAAITDTLWLLARAAVREQIAALIEEKRAARASNAEGANSHT